MINKALHLIHERENNREKAIHEDNKAKGRSMLPVSRRRFVQGLAAGGAGAALDWRAGWAFAETGQQQTLATLTGKDFELTIDSLPATRAWAAIGIQGLAPYFFNFAPTLYVRDGGRVAGRISGLYDLYLTQCLILQPQVELNFYSQAHRGRGTGTGLSGLGSGVRLGYGISRKFAPYIGFTYSSSFGQTATFARRAGEPVHASSLVFGVWIWK
jgi:hypothetical protein